MIPWTGPRRVDAVDERDSKQRQQTDQSDAKLEKRINAQRVMARGNESREDDAAQAHAAHERAKQDTQ